MSGIKLPPQIISRESLFIDEQEVIGRARFNPPFEANAILENEARLMFAVRGTSRLIVPDRKVNVQTHEAVLMKCECFLNHWHENPSDSPSEAIIIRLYPQVLDSVFSSGIPVTVKAKNSGHRTVEKISNRALTAYVESLQSLFDNPSLASDDLLRVKIKELLLLLINTDENGEVNAILGDLFNNNSYDFKEVIHANLYEDLRLDDLAFLTGLSLSTFKRKFQVVFGMNPSQYFRSRRLEKACELLINSGRRISDIAYDCGYNDVGYFSKIFSAQFNKSPSQFRKSNVS